MSIKVLLADNHEIMRDGLKSLLEADPGLEVVGEASNGREAVNKSIEHSPDVVVMDIGMPELNGIEATRKIITQLPQTKVVVLSMHQNASYLTKALKAGAKGYVLKDSTFQELNKAIYEVFKGNTFFSPDMNVYLISGFLSESPIAQDSISVLTNREREVLQLMAEGYSAKEIAAKLHVSSKTVDNHRHNLMNKLGLKNIAELVKFAIREGLTAIDS